MKKRHLNLWLTFVLSVLFIMIFSTMAIFFIMITLINMGFDFPFRDRSVFRILIPLVTSTCVGTLLSMLIGNTILKPIRKFNQALTNVAKGDFSISLKEDQTVYELNEMVHNYNIMVKELSSIETLRNDFVANVSHEFKTPLSNIEGYVTLLQANDIPVETKEKYIQVIIHNTRQLSNLTSNILKISKLENQETLPEKSWFSLDEQIRQAILVLEPKWSKKNLEFDIQLSSISYHADEELFMQVWMNLLDNAIKFSKDHGEIQVFAYQREDELFVSIADSGIGFDPNVSAHLFEKFYQADNSRLLEGNGLGLALVKQILYLSDGHILVESKPEEGSKFTVVLPIIKIPKKQSAVKYE